MFDSLIARIKASYQRRQDRKAFFSKILAAAAHGRFTDQETADFLARIQTLRLTDHELQHVRSLAYSRALTAAATHADVTDAVEHDLAHIQELLHIPDVEILASKSKLLRLKTISDAKSGVLPIINNPEIVLQKNERAHWRVEASLLEERVVSRRYEGGSQGVSIRLAKGVSWRIGAQSGHLIADKAVVPVSAGAFVVTDKRLVFSGDRKSFSVAYPKLLDAHMFTDGIRVTPSSGKPYVLRFADAESADVIGAVVSQALKNAMAA